MKILFVISVTVLKLIHKLTTLLHLGVGLNRPLKPVLKIIPKFGKYFYNINEDKIIFVTGSNGKSTTTKTIVDMIGKQKVATNSSGANQQTGFYETLVLNSTILGKFKKEFFIFECDEGSFDLTTKWFKPNIIVLTNLLVDQVNRNLEPYYVFKKLVDTIPMESTILYNSDNTKLLPARDLVNKNKKSFSVLQTRDDKKEGNCPVCNLPVITFDHTLTGNYKFECKECKSDNINEIDFKLKNKQGSKKINFNNQEYLVNDEDGFMLYAYAAALSICTIYKISNEEILNNITTIKPLKDRFSKYKIGNLDVLFFRNKEESVEAYTDIIEQISANYNNNGTTISFEIEDVHDYHIPYLGNFWIFNQEWKKLDKANLVLSSTFLDYDFLLAMEYNGLNRDKIKTVRNHELNKIVGIANSNNSKTLIIVSKIGNFDKINKQLMEMAK